MIFYLTIQNWRNKNFHKKLNTIFFSSFVKSFVDVGKKLVRKNFDVDAFSFQSETLSLEVTITIGIGGGVGVGGSIGTVSVSTIGIGVSVRSVVEGLSVSLGLSLTLGNLVDDSGGGGGVVSGGLDDGGDDGVGVGSVEVGDGVNGGGNNLLLGLGLNNLVSLDLSDGLLGLGDWDDVWVVVVVVHQGVVVGDSAGGLDDGDGGGGGDMRLVGHDSVGVVVSGIGFRLSEGHSGKSENYELEKKRRLLNFVEEKF
jgi:hypothetical protein